MITQKNVPETFRSRGLRAEISGTFSAAADRARKCAGRFPQLRIARENAKDEIRSRGLRPEMRKMKSAAADCVRKCAGQNPQPRIARGNARGKIRSRGLRAEMRGMKSAAADYMLRSCEILSRSFYHRRFHLKTKKMHAIKES
jgi:hypothetical protein